MKSVSFCYDKITNFEKKILCINDNLKSFEADIKKKNKFLKSEVTNLNNKRNDLDKCSKINHIIINKMSEKKTENF